MSNGNAEALPNSIRQYLEQERGVTPVLVVVFGRKLSDKTDAEITYVREDLLAVQKPGSFDEKKLHAAHFTLSDYEQSIDVDGFLIRTCFKCSIFGCGWVPC